MPREAPQAKSDWTHRGHRNTKKNYAFLILHFFFFYFQGYVERVCRLFTLCLCVKMGRKRNRRKPVDSFFSFFVLLSTIKYSS